MSRHYQNGHPRFRGVSNQGDTKAGANLKWQVQEAKNLATRNEGPILSDRKPDISGMHNLNLASSERIRSAGVLLRVGIPSYH